MGMRRLRIRHLSGSAQRRLRRERNATGEKNPSGSSDGRSHWKSTRSHSGSRAGEVISPDKGSYDNVDGSRGVKRKREECRSFDSSARTERGENSKCKPGDSSRANSRSNDVGAVAKDGDLSRNCEAGGLRRDRNPTGTKNPSSSSDTRSYRKYNRSHSGSRGREIAGAISPEKRSHENVDGSRRANRKREECRSVDDLTRTERVEKRKYRPGYSSRVNNRSNDVGSAVKEGNLSRSSESDSLRMSRSGRRREQRRKESSRRLSNDDCVTAVKEGNLSRSSESDDGLRMSRSGRRREQRRKKESSRRLSSDDCVTAVKEGNLSRSSESDGLRMSRSGRRREQRRRKESSRRLSSDDCVAVVEKANSGRLSGDNPVTVVEKEHCVSAGNFRALPKPLGHHVGKKLLVLDLNGLLCDVVYGNPHTQKPRQRVGKCVVFKRPFCDDFMMFCCEKFEIGVWSSRKMENVQGVINYIMKDVRDKFLFCWDATKCTYTGLQTIENRRKPLVLKQLKKIWSNDDGDLPCKKGDFSPSNTLLLDDSPCKALCNPPYTGVFPYPYEYTNEADDSLGPGGDLRVFLEGLALADDVQCYVREHPFGQRAITTASSSWKYYEPAVGKINESSVAAG